MMNEVATQETIDINDYTENLWHLYADEIRFYIARNLHATPDDIEDLLLQTFEDLHTSLKFRPREITNIRAYLYAMARNIWRRDTMSASRKLKTVSTDIITRDDESLSIFDSLPDPAYTPEEAFLNREQITDLEAQISQLSYQEQTVLRLSYFSGWTIDEIAFRLGLSRPTVYTCLARAKRRLRRDLRSETKAKEEQLPKKPIEPAQDFDSNVRHDEQLRPAPDLPSRIAQLPDPYRSVLTLAMLEGRKYTQIAALRGCPLGTIKGQVSRGIRLLRARQQPRQSPIVVPQQPFTAPRELPLLNALPTHYRIILTQREIHGFTYAQIAAQLQISLPCVKKRLHRARAAYHKLLNQPSQQPRKTPRRRNIPLEKLSHLNHTSYRHFYDALYLAYIEHLSDEEIANQLHRPVGTVKSHLTRGATLLLNI